MEDIPILIEQYTAAITAHHRAQAALDHTLANRHFHQADKLLCQIQLCPGWVEAFLPLLSHAHPTVRIYAATALLPYEPRQAKRVLKKSRFAPGNDGITARMVLAQWRTGELAFPVLENGQVVYRSQAK